MNKKILALSVHPNLSGNYSSGDIKKSFANNIVLNELAHYPGVTIHRIAEVYPNYQIDVSKEQQMLMDHDLILIIGPIYWYSLPAIAKLWIDSVLLYGWAYGSQGNALIGKEIQLVITSGSSLQEYSHLDIGSTIEELFVPFQRSFEYCKMTWKPIQFIGNLNSNSITSNKEAQKEKLKRFTKDLIKTV